MTVATSESMPLEVMVAGDGLVSLLDPKGLQLLMAREEEGGGPAPWLRMAWEKQLRRVPLAYRTPALAGLLLQAAGREEGNREAGLSLWRDAVRLTEVWRGEGLQGDTYDEGPLATSWEGLPLALRALREEGLLVEVASYQREARSFVMKPTAASSRRPLTWPRITPEVSFYVRGTVSSYAPVLFRQAEGWWVRWGHFHAQALLRASASPWGLYALAGMPWEAWGERVWPLTPALAAEVALGEVEAFLPGSPRRMLSPRHLRARFDDLYPSTFGAPAGGVTA